MTLVYSGFTRATLAPERVLIRYNHIELALSLLQEYQMTWPAMQKQGVYGDHWRWMILEAPCDGCKVNLGFEMVILTAQVVNVTEGGPVSEFSLLTARKEVP